MAPSSGRFEYDMLTSFAAVLFVLQFDRGGSFSMLSQGHVMVMNAGEDVDLHCEFYTKYFSLFNNPVLWIKTQSNEEMPINIMGNINKPFLGQRRFKVIFTPEPPRYELKLRIERLSRQDSGNYTCEVRGPETTILAVITHKLFIRAPLQDLILNKNNCTENCDSVTPAHLSFKENDPSALQCVATGGNPPPDVRIYLNDFDITYRFVSVTHWIVLGERGLRKIHANVHSRTNYLVLDAADDTKTLRCTATVPGLPKNSTTSIVHVEFAPVITCEEKSAYEGQKNAYVSCQVRSRPSASTIFWIVNNGSIVSEGSPKNEYWTWTQNDQNMNETKLYMRLARPDYFKKYTLVAENIVGKTTGTVRLVRKEHDPLDDGSRIPYYSEREDAAHAGQMDYVFIHAGAQRHLANVHVVVVLTFHVSLGILSCV